MKTKPEFFGQDRTNIPAVRTDLLALAEAQPDDHWAALIDAAFDYPAPDASPYWSRGINCYGGPAYEGLRKAAPILVPLDPVYDQAFLTRLLRHCHDRPMVSFLASRFDLNTLCQSWEPLHWITAIDHQKMLLRLADTRILAELPRILEPSQWAAFAAPVTQWAVVNRSGRLTPLPLPAPDAAKASSIHLLHEQLAALLSAAEPDNILALIVDSMSDILPQDLPGSRAYAMVSDSCALARKHEVTNWADVVSLSVAAFLTEGKTNQNESLTAYLARKQWPPGDLGTSLVSESFL
ncbi:DUF4123 domain-containing protein [Duganella sp. Root198D2]|uniref:DUF4123 domain-containing protein n=1 Tax=Duganella sp. Root198D2 TaxID=1736489 RepID=UPI00070ADDB7|nr:DUF4123 domain-containing protein [Duganella sp. Root198D2]KRB83699.1 hypothetical protein ASE26_11065 [Duganella sp. Root198D2]